MNEESSNSKPVEQDSMLTQNDSSLSPHEPQVVAQAENSRSTLTIVLLVAVLTAVLLSYWNINQRLSTLEQGLNSVETSIPNLPQATIEAIMAWQRGEAPAAAAPAEPTVATVSIDNDAFIGDKETAQLAIIEFSDFNCPFCARFHTETLALILDKYVRSGQAIYVYRDFIGVGGEVSLAAASAAECVKEIAGDQVYLDVVSGLYASSGTKNVARVESLALEFEVDQSQFASCVAENRYRQEVIADTQAGQQAGVRGTPAFFIGLLDPDGSVTATALPGAQPFEVFDTIISQQLLALN